MSPVPSVTFRSELDPVVRKELDQFDSELTEFLLSQHDDDGHHTHVTAISIAPHGPGPLALTGPLAITGPVTIDGQPVGSGAAPAAHHATHEPGGSDALANAAWTNLANTFAALNQFTPGVAERGRTVPMGEWQAYTPVWASSGTQPVRVGGSLAGRYTVIGKTCHFGLILNTAAGTTFGTGYYTLSVPLAGVALPLLSGMAIISGQYWQLNGQLITATTFYMYCTTGTAHNDVISSVFPVAAAAGDRIYMSGTYELA